ncbi:FMN-binding negative transcriptional regulator [Denitratisoma sp. agr-D3]
MYLPPHFQESRPEVLEGFIAQHALGTIVVHDASGLAADPVPLLLRHGQDGSRSLVGHVARANPLWQKARSGIPCLVIFQGHQHYISPNWYATKAETGKVVPTWNYEVVQVQGRLFAMDDRVWLRDCLVELTARHEASQPVPWTLADAPEDYIDARLTAIVGIRIEISDMVGKAKLSQNQVQANRWSAINALREQGSHAAQQMADAIAHRDGDLG